MRCAGALLTALENLRDRLAPERPAATGFLDVQIEQLGEASSPRELLRLTLDMLTQQEEALEVLPQDMAQALTTAQRDLAQAAGDLPQSDALLKTAEAAIHRIKVGAPTQKALPLG